MSNKRLLAQGGLQPLDKALNLGWQVRAAGMLANQINQCASHHYGISKGGNQLNMFRLGDTETDGNGRVGIGRNLAQLCLKITAELLPSASDTLGGDIIDKSGGFVSNKSFTRFWRCWGDQKQKL